MSTGACLVRHFVFGSHQSKAPIWRHWPPLATRNSNTYRPNIISQVFWRAAVRTRSVYMHGGRVGVGWESWGWGEGGSWAGLHAPTLSARCGRDLHKSLAATAVHQIHTHLWAAIIWWYIKGIYSPWYRCSQSAGWRSRRGLTPWFIRHN